MHQRIVIRPTADPRQPRFKQSELILSKLTRQVLKQKHRKDFLLKILSREKFVSRPQQEGKSEFLENCPSAFHRCPAQISRIPSVRFNLFLEEPLHARRMLGRTAILQQAANLRGCPPCINSLHPVILSEGSCPTSICVHQRKSAAAGCGGERRTTRS